VFVLGFVSGFDPGVLKNQNPSGIIERSEGSREKSPEFGGPRATSGLATVSHYVDTGTRLRWCGSLGVSGDPGCSGEGKVLP
jgi:hypothetical protein